VILRSSERPVGPVSRRRVVAALAGVALAAAGCRGEGRPNVEVIGGAETASVSELEPEGAAGGTPASAGGGYPVGTNVDIYFAMALDLRDIRAVLSPPTGRPDWAAAQAIYEQGRNQRGANGATRPLASLPNDAVHAVFTNGPAVFGRAAFVDGLVRDGLAGTGRAAGLSDDARRQIVEKALMMLFYGKALQELAAARTRVASGAANAVGPVDETFAILAGPVENNARPHALLATAAERERDLQLAGKLAGPLETALTAARAAAESGDRAAFDRAGAETTGYLNSIFYLSVLRGAKLLEGDAAASSRQVHLAEGWGYWQTIRAAATSGSPAAAREVESALSRAPTANWAAAETSRVYASLNDPAVLSALGVPGTLQLKTPPKQ
jgi:hypothetical protein